MTTSINWTAARAYARLAAPIIGDSDSAADADAGFDGGEWSRGWHASDLSDQLAVLSARVAAHFGIDAEDFSGMLFVAYHEADERGLAGTRSTP